MNWKGYLGFGFLTIPLAFLSIVFWMFNFFTILLIDINSNILRKYDYLVNTADLTHNFVIGLIYPLTLAPLHWLNYKILRWNIWTYILLFLVTNFIIAFLVLFYSSDRPVCYYGCPPVE